ncbi:MAG TPA: minichromosome maintenance protein MCM [Candidatus Nanoarchaeia archaeon]|nr:minichromosome maintenance protein MCM [Candidatus Nanoarchaeia archaeon]
MEKRDFSDEIQANEEEIPKEIDTRKNKQEDLLIEAKNFFEAHKKELLESRRKGSNVVFLDFESLIKFSKMLSDEILEDPEEALRIFEQAIEQSPLIDSVRIRLKNLPKSQTVKIRNIRSKHLNEMIVVEGIIRQASDVQPQVVNAKFECPGCGTVIQVLQIEKKFREPSRCSCGRKGGFKLISKEMVDVQRLIVEEAHESLSGGEQPKKINVFVKEDLVEPKMEEKTTPGSRVRVIGVLKEVAVTLPTGGLSTRFGLAIEANNLIPLEETFDEVGYDEEDEKQILELSQSPNIFDKLAESIAPSVWGYEEIKKSLILQLFGGVKKELSDGSNQRGDIHILLVGDPGVAKSVILGFMSKIAPKGRYVVGKSTSGAGLTATVVKDEFLRGWALEAGAMVLANKGLVCIDELEKMDPQDRSAMHEAMEQQSVTISKANVQASLKAETSVLAAANPKFGRFDPYQPIAQQIDLPPTLINRFDIMFTLRDLPDRKKDARIATHVLSEHTKETETLLISRDLLRKYVAYSKQRIKPTLTKEAIEELKSFYVELRNKPVSSESALRPIPISARQLQALVRMSEAAAKVRLSESVSKQDAQQSIEIMKYYLRHVGFDYESQTFDIDRIGSGFSHSQRSKIFTVKETIIALSSRMGKEIPIEEIKNDLKDKMKEGDIEEAIEKLIHSNEIYRPKHGYVGVF